MTALNGKRVVVVGGSRGVGRAIVGAAQAAGAHVLAVARGTESLATVAAAVPGVATLALDASDEAAPATLFATALPDVLVLCGGAERTKSPLHELEWREFSGVWDNDVKASFLFCKAALTRPLPPGTVVIQISSGAAIGGSPISGGYAGAKRMQMFMANYCQRESDRLELGLRFLTLAPKSPMPDTPAGIAAVNGYAKYLGVAPAEFIKNLGSPQTAADVADAVLAFAGDPGGRPGNVFVVSRTGVEAHP